MFCIENIEKALVFTVKVRRARFHDFHGRGLEI